MAELRNSFKNLKSNLTPDFIFSMPGSGKVGFLSALILDFTMWYS